MNELTFSEKTRSAIGEFDAYIAGLFLDDSEAERIAELLHVVSAAVAEDAFAFGVSEGVKSAIEATREALGIDDPLTRS